MSRTTRPEPGDAPAPRLFATMERTALDGTLGGVQLRTGPAGVMAVLAQDPAALDRTSLALARIANGVLPLWTIGPMRQALAQRQLLPGLVTLISNVAESIDIVGPQAPPLPATYAGLRGLLSRHRSFVGIELLGMQAVNNGMDMREIGGAYQIFLVDRCLGALDRRFRDPSCPQDKKDSILNDFGPALVLLEDVLQDPVAHREALRALRGELELEVADAQADAELAELALRLRHNLVVPRQALFAAARRHLQKKSLVSGPLADTAAPGELPATRRIF